MIIKNLLPLITNVNAFDDVTTVISKLIEYYVIICCLINIINII